MKRGSHILIAAAAALAASSFVLGQPKPTPQRPDESAGKPAAAANEQIERGRYLTALGDCVACHTEEGGARFAGGRPLQTPFGTVLSANLTPDEATGIGRYTADTFYRALHEGIDEDGRHLYPAFPYNYYTHITREDSDAIFAYLQTIPKVQKRLDRNQLPFPFNIRWLMTFWNWLYLDEGPYRPDDSKSAEWNRGAYLVEGLGHCQACHTPRNILGGSKTDQAFHGGTFAEWFAPDITSNRRTGLGSWSREELLHFLRHGNNVHSAASAEMGEVVTFSTSQMNEGDLSALVTYLREVSASPSPDVKSPAEAVMTQGQAIWEDACSACHRMNGEGVAHLFPTLKGNPNLQQSNPATVLHFILTGTRRSPTASAPTPLSMPAFYWKLDDSQVAAVATYARNSWGNKAPAVKPEDVADLRAKLHFGDDEGIPASTMNNPGVHTRAPANTDSRDNGTPRAGTVAPAHDELDGGGSGGEADGGKPKGGHPAGVPTGGPG
jgi:mono/diheme cytochrome c family protein